MAQDTKLPPRPAHSRAKSSVRSDTSEDSLLRARRAHTGRERPASKPDARSKSDEATAAFVRRTLCTHQLHNGGTPDNNKPSSTSQQLEDVLPPLTSSNEVDLQLYALISIIIKDFVQSWYSKITPDHEFVDEVIHIIAHCTRGLEQRLRRIDVETLLLDEVPGLLNAHTRAYRIAHDKESLASLGVSAREIYHTLEPHPALSPVPSESSPFTVEDQAANEAAWRQLLVQGVLSLLLPPEDVQNPCLRVLVGEILSEMIIGNGIGGKACEGWLIWDGVSKVVKALNHGQVTIAENASSPLLPNRLEEFGLVSSQNERAVPTPKSRRSYSDFSVQLAWQLAALFSSIFLTIRTLFLAFARSASLPQRPIPAQALHVVQRAASNDEAVSEPAITTGSKQVQSKRPILEMSAFSSPVGLLLLDIRMPWLTGVLSMVQTLLVYGPSMVGCTNSRLDRLLSYYIHTYMLNPQLLPNLLLTIRTTLFPNNTLGPARPVPSPVEVLAIKRDCVESIVVAIPDYIRKVYFGTNDREEMLKQTEELLDVFGDAYLNKHLIFAAVDHVVCRLFPEMERVGVAAQLREKLG